jgi:hypothetical protein
LLPPFRCVIFARIDRSVSNSFSAGGKRNDRACVLLRTDLDRAGLMI